MNEEPELKSCPFCGTHKKYLPKVIELKIPLASKIYTVACDKCGANCGYEGSEADAIIRWNTRIEE